MAAYTWYCWPRSSSCPCDRKVQVVVGKHNVVGFVGGGKMAEALISGLLRDSSISVSQVVVTETHPERVAYLERTYGIRSAPIDELPARADILVIAVKPQVVDTVIESLAPQLGDRHVVISVAAGVPTTRYEEAFGQTPVVRVMPNTPALVGQGIAVLAAGAHAGADQVQIARRILAPTGAVLELPEDQLDAVTAVSGTGPAYFFLLAELLIDAAVEIGLERDVATQLVVQTAIGAGVMLRDSGDDAATLRAAVTSPNGTTAAAMDVFEGRGIAQTVQAAVRAARDRSVELGH